MQISKKTEKIVRKLEEAFCRMVRKDTHRDFKECLAFQALRGMKGMEIWFLPEKDNYEDCLSKLKDYDVVFDVGAGDLRFDLIMAEKVRKVYAVEINPKVLAGAMRIIGYDMPTNLTVICGDAFDMDLPPDVTVVTCLMVHRKHEFPVLWRLRRIISYERNI